MLAAVSNAIGMNWVAFTFVIVVLVIGIIELFTSAWKSLIGWALVFVAAAILINFCTTWAHTVHT
jgi:hypothetical protein